MMAVKKLLFLLPLLATLSLAAASPPPPAEALTGIYVQEGARDCWYLSAKGAKLQILAGGWGGYWMEPVAPLTYKVKDWPDSEFKFETTDSFVQYKAGKTFKVFKLDKKASALLLTGQALSPASVAGIWKGTFKAMLIYSADIFVHLDQGSGGKCSASMDIPKGKLQGQKLSWVDLEHGVVGFDFLGGLYFGKLSEDGTKLVGSIYGNKKLYPFDMQRVDKIPD